MQEAITTRPEEPIVRLTDRYRPDRLSAVVGQPSAKVLAQFAKNPYRECFLCEGSPGTGKTTAALALAAELGATDEFSGLIEITASELSVDAARNLMRRLSLVPMQGPTGWHIVLLEELERLSPQCQVYLKTALERDLPRKAIVVATSNDSSGLQPALIQRFKSLHFGSGKPFAEDGNLLVAQLWMKEFGPNEPMPHGWMQWGYMTGRNGSERFSLRSALDNLQLALLRKAVAA